MEHHVIDPDVARGVFDIVGDAAVDRWVFAKDEWHASTDVGDHVDHERLASNQDPVVQASFDDLLEEADKITFVSDDAALLASLHEKAAAKVRRPGDDRPVADLLSRRHREVRRTRATASPRSPRRSAYPLTQTAAIGDQANDLPMLALASVSIAMGNAPDAVKAKAQHVTAGNDAAGVARAIDDIILTDDGVRA